MFHFERQTFKFFPKFTQDAPQKTVGQVQYYLYRLCPQFIVGVFCISNLTR